MSSPAYQYNRMGWRSKYDILPSKSNYSSSLRRTYTNDTSPYTNYTSLPRKSFSSVHDTSFNVAHARRKSYSVLHTKSYDTPDRDRTHEAIRRKSYASLGKSESFDPVGNRSNISTATYRNGIVGSMHSTHKSTITTETVCKDTMESKYNVTTSMRNSNFKNNETIGGTINDTTTSKNTIRTGKMLNGHMELSNGVVVHKKSLDTKPYEMYDKLDSSTKASIERKISAINGRKDYSTTHIDDDYNITHAHRKLPEPPSNKSLHDRNKIFPTSESKYNGTPAILSSVSVENKYNVTMASKYNGITENIGTSVSKRDVSTDVSKCNGVVQGVKSPYWKSKYNSDIGYKYSSANGSKYNGVSESKYNDISESKYNGISESKCNGISERKYNDISESKYNGISESKYNGISESKYNGISESKYNGISESKYNGLSEIKTNGAADFDMKSKSNVTMETESNVTMETKCNVAVEGNINRNIEKKYSIAQGRINVVLETKINLVVESECNGTGEIHCNGTRPENIGNIAATVGRYKGGKMEFLYNGIKENKTNCTSGTKCDNIMENSSNIAMKTNTNVAMESKSNISMETKRYIAMETKSNVAMETKSNVVMETKSNVAMENQPNVTMETKSNVAVETKNNFAMENKSNDAMETENNDAMETRSSVAMVTKNNVDMESKSNDAMEIKNNVAMETISTVTMDTKSYVAMETKSNVAMEKNCDSTTESFSKVFSNGTMEHKRNGIVGGDMLGPVKKRPYDTVSGKVKGIGQERSYNTIYRNQYNRKQGRPLYAERITDFEHNALCLWLALQRIHQGFLKVFHMYFPTKPGLLYKALTSHRVKLFQLQQRGLIDKNDWDLLFPQDGDYTNSSTFDLVLISLLLRTVCEYREPKEGWWKVAAGTDRIDTIHFSKIFSVCTELSKCNFSINDTMFELLRKRLEKYTTMLGPLPNETLVSDNEDSRYSDEFIQFSVAKGKLKSLEKKMLRVEGLLKAVWWQVPCYTATHVNRKIRLGDVIEERLKLTETNKDDVDDPSTFALVGPSGIGKTETARFWAYHYSQIVDGNVIWIDSENLSNIDTAFVKLAKRLGLSLQDKFGKPVIVDGLHYHIYEYFANHKSLFIFDNVKDDSILQQIIPQSKRLYPVILVTSQCKTLRGDIVSHDLEKFTNDDAAQLIEKIADHCDIRDTQKLSEKMNHLPFALELASYIISKRGIAIMEFIRLFDRMTKGVNYERDGRTLVGVLVQMFIDACAYEKNKACIEDLLCVMSLMHGNKIDMELLLQWQDHSKVNIKAALKEMSSYSLIKMTNYRDMNSKKCSFTMHSTIQRAIKKSKLDQACDNTTFHLNGFLEMYHLRKVLDMVDHYREYENKLCPSYGVLWAHHIMNILYNYKSCKGVMFKLETFKHDIAIFNIQNRHYKSALHILDVFRRFELSLKVDNEDLLLDTEREYGNCFLMQGNFDAALSVFLKIHAKERHIFENVQEPTLMTRFHIGICLQYLAISERQSTTETESACGMLQPRGTGKMFKKEDEKMSAALSVFQDVYNKANKTLHGRHPLVVTAFHHIGICKYYQGDLSTALKIFLKVSEIVLDLDCERQPNNFLMEDQLRRVDERGGEHLSSDLAAFEELYARQKDLLGDTHPIALESKSQIAKCLQEVGSFLPALKHFSEIYAELKNLYGEEHPRSLACREDIGNCLRRTKEFSAAFEIYNDVSKKRHLLLGENHPHTLDAQYETGTCLYYLNEFESATIMLQRVFERKKKVLGELHTSTLLTKQTYAICLRDSGDTSHASKILLEVYEKYKIVYGENHPTTLSSRQQIGICHLRQLRFSIAYDVLKEVYDKYHALFGEENLRTLTSEYYVSLCLMKLGKFMDALILLRNICDNLDKLIGLDEPIYLDSAHHLGICLQAQGYLWTAINVFQEVYNLRKNQKDNTSTLCSSHRLAMCCLDIGNHFAARYAFTELYESLSKK